MKPIRSCSLVIRVILGIGIVFSLQQFCLSQVVWPNQGWATTRADSSGWLARPHTNDSGWNHYTEYWDAVEAKMNWTSGGYQAGINECPARSYVETKYANKIGNSGQPEPFPKKFKGFSDTCIGSGIGNKAFGGGFGSSQWHPNWNWPWKAAWTVTATGRGSYYGYVNGADPWPLLRQDLVPTPEMDIFIPIGIEAGSFTVQNDDQSYIGFDVSYKTAGGSDDLLQIVISADGVYVTTGSINSSSVELYSMTYDPLQGLSAASTDPSKLLEASTLQSMLEQDLIPGQYPGTLSLENPIYIGVVVRSVRVPTLPMPSGSYADASVSSFAYVGTKKNSSSQ